MEFVHRSDQTDHRVYIEIIENHRFDLLKTKIKRKKNDVSAFFFLNDFVYYSAYSQDQHPSLLMMVLIELGVDFHLIDRCTMSMKELDHKDFL